MRKKRQLQQGARYHVIARANRQEFILNSREIKELLIKVIQQAKKKYAFKILTLCVMDNHFHCILMPIEEANLSKIMQWILSVFAIRFNKLYNFKGHVWYDRFKSKIIWNYRQFLATYIYIAENPVRAGIVTNPFDYEYNAISFIKQGNFNLLDPPDILISLIPLNIVPTLLPK